MRIFTRAPHAVRMPNRIHAKKTKKTKKTQVLLRIVYTHFVFAIFGFPPKFFVYTTILSNILFFYVFFRFFTQIPYYFLTSCVALVRILNTIQALTFSTSQKTPRPSYTHMRSLHARLQKSSEKSAKKVVPASLDLSLLYTITSCENEKKLQGETSCDPGGARWCMCATQISA